MLEDRRYSRSDCEEKCMLNLKGWYYPATVKNISDRGVLVATCNPLNDIHSGESCTVIMSEDSLREYFCNVVRVIGFDVALRIIDGYSDSPFEHIIAKLHGGLWRYKTMQLEDRPTAPGRTKWNYYEGTSLAPRHKTDQPA